MKNLKVRVYDKVTKKMFKPQAISFDIQTSAPFAVSVPGRSWEPIQKYELMQWTGFCDENGTEVYEADLVEISSVTYKIVWNNDLVTYELAELDGLARLELNTLKSGKVIGNLYQHSA